MFKRDAKVVDVDFGLGNTAVPGTASNGTSAGILFLNGTVEGFNTWNRTGRYAKFFRIDYNFSLSILSNSMVKRLSPAPMRMVFIFDRFPEGSIPVWSDIFGTRHPNGGSFSGVLAPINQDHIGRYVILHDEIIQAPFFATGAQLDNGSLTGVTIVRAGSVKNRELTQFSGAASGIGDISHGAIYLAFRQLLWQEGAGTWTFENDECQCRLFFSD